MSLSVRARAQLALSNLTRPLWWKDAALRAVYSAVAIALPYIAAASIVAEVSWLTILSAGALGFLASLVTSVAGLPEVEGVDLPWWLAAVERVVKTFCQALAAGLVGGVLLSDIPWGLVLQAAALAALTSLLRLILATLPNDPSPEAGAVEFIPPTKQDVDHALASGGSVITDAEGRVLAAEPRTPKYLGGHNIQP